MIKPFQSPILSALLLFSFVAWIASCGSSVENPVEESDDDVVLTQMEQPQTLKVKTNVSQDTVRPGETVTMTATVEPVRGTRIMLDWINVTKHGTLTVTGQNSATWVAPETMETVDVQVEVIQLLVTTISHVVSVKESGINTDTEVLSDTRTILLTVTPN